MAFVKWPPEDSDYLYDLKLSLEAKGLFTMILCGPLHPTSPVDMAKRAVLSIHRMRKVLRELEGEGYLARTTSPRPRPEVCGCCSWQYRRSRLTDYRGFGCG
jgi:DNA-binding MarR family transcriptional regulator